jgi:hypothetical protein
LPSLVRQSVNVTVDKQLRPRSTQYSAGHGRPLPPAHGRASLATASTVPLPRTSDTLRHSNAADENLPDSKIVERSTACPIENETRVMLASAGSFASPQLLSVKRCTVSTSNIASGSDTAKCA